MSDATTDYACWACGAPAQPEPRWLPLRMWRCPSCGLLFTPERTAQEVKALYDADYFEAYPGGEDYTDDVAQRQYEADRRIAWLRRHGAHGRMLEIGAAAGHFVEAATADGFEAQGIEPAAPLAAQARERGVHVDAGYIEELDLADASFDLVCAWHVIEHVADPLPSLQQLRRVLRPGAPLFIEVPNIDSVWAKRLGPRWANLDPEHHVAHYTVPAMRALLERAGYVVSEIDTLSMLAYLRPGRALRPRELAATAYKTAIVGTLRNVDPSRHEMLRAVAIRPLD